MIYNLVILDGLNVSHKYFWKHIGFSYNGYKTGLYYGFLQNIFSLRKKYDKAKIIICWDSPNLKKKVMSSDYKSDRKKKPDEFYESVKNLKVMLSLLGVTQYYSIGIEADDICARVIKKNKNKKILMMSQDSDWIQFMTKKTDIYKNKEVLNIDEALKLIGFKTTRNFTLFLCIVGTHNNVPGVKGIGEKKYDQVKELIVGRANIDKVVRAARIKNDKVSKMIYDNRELVKSNYKLVVPILSGYKIKSIEKENNDKKLIDLCEKFGLKSIIKKVDPDYYENELKDF